MYYCEVLMCMCILLDLEDGYVVSVSLWLSCFQALCQMLLKGYHKLHECIMALKSICHCSKACSKPLCLLKLFNLGDLYVCLLPACQATRKNKKRAMR